MFTALLFWIAGCASVISKQVRKQVSSDVTFAEVLKDPEHYKDQMIVLSGIIIDVKNTNEETLLEVLQSPAGFRGEPKDIDKSEGRFLALGDRYLDTKTYTKGRSITVAGTVQEKRILPLGKTEYTYPLIRVNEIYLWPIIRRHHPYSYYSYNRYYWWRRSLLHQRRLPRKSR